MSEVPRLSLIPKRVLNLLIGLIHHCPGGSWTDMDIIYWVFISNCVRVMGNNIAVYEVIYFVLYYLYRLNVGHLRKKCP